MGCHERFARGKSFWRSPYLRYQFYALLLVRNATPYWISKERTRLGYRLAS